MKDEKTTLQKSNMIIDLLKEFDYKNSEEGICASVQTASGKEEMLMTSPKFVDIIAGRFYREIGKTVSTSTVRNSISAYQGFLYETLEKSKARFRIYMEENNSAIYVDKGDNDYHYFKITADGWSEETGGEKYFKRSPSTAEFPTPDKKHACFDLLFKHCRVPDNMKNILKAWIISCFIDIQHPCLIIQGEAGSSKSTLCRILKMLIDPCVNNEPLVFPDNASDLKDIYTQMYFAAYDNLEKLKKKQSDFLCSMVTGAQIVRRKLFTDSQSCSYFLRQPIVLNGIKGIVTREDLMSRSIVLELPKISSDERKSEKALMREFKKDLPAILAGIFDILSEVLGTYKEDIFDDTPRMADFYDFGYAICETYNKGDDFRDEYLSLIDKQMGNDRYENVPLLGLLQILLDNEENCYWSGTMTVLWEELKKYANYCEASIPNSPTLLSRELRMIKDYLDKNEINIRFSSTYDNCRFVEIEYFNEKPIP